jgi:hypothetical protein
MKGSSNTKNFVLSDLGGSSSSNSISSSVLLVVLVVIRISDSSGSSRGSSYFTWPQRTCFYELLSSASYCYCSTQIGSQPVPPANRIVYVLIVIEGKYSLSSRKLYRSEAANNHMILNANNHMILNANNHMILMVVL